MTDLICAGHVWTDSVAAASHSLEVFVYEVEFSGILVLFYKAIYVWDISDLSLSVCTGGQRSPQCLLWVIVCVSIMYKVHTVVLNYSIAIVQNLLVQK